MRLVMVLLAAGLLAGCRNPLTIDRDTEVAIGRDAAARLEAQHGVVEDAALQRRLDAMGAAIAAGTEEPGFPWSFKVLDTAEVNALALPGGFVYVTRGMVEYVRDDDELAGVIGHEAAHIAHRHAKSHIERAMAQGLVVELVTRRSSDAIRQAADIALDLQLRQGYRDKEYEADRYGTLYSFRAGYRPDGLRRLLSRLHEDTGDPARITWVLQTHPPLSRRIERLQEYLVELTGRPAGVG